jgi:hypothetical protein
MQWWRNGVHAWIGLWILAGLAVAAVNGYMLASLLDEPLAGYSQKARIAQRGLRQYQVLLTAKAERFASEMDLLAERFKPVETAIERPALIKAAIPVPRKKRTAPPVVLPNLAGIVTRQSADGADHCLALLDGRFFSEGDTIGDLTVQKISDNGVLLARAGRTWFLKTPEVACSRITR